MPAIIIHSLELTEEQKKTIAERYITTFSELTNVPKDRIYLFFNGYPLEDAATNGVLFSENPPRGIVGKFNPPEEE